MHPIYLKAWLGNLQEAVRRKAAALNPAARIRKLHEAAHRKFPRFVSDPNLQRRLALHRSRDDEENRRSVPPEDEAIRLRCVWAIEYYFPSHFDRLIDGFTRLGWHKEDSAFAMHSPTKWLRQRRETLAGGGWLNLGTIERPGIGSKMPGSRRAPLPDDVAFASGQLYSITNSVYCVVLAFFLNEEAMLRYDKALRLTYRTELKPLKRGYSIIGPESQKRTAINEIRTALRTDLAGWFSTHLPGFFTLEKTGADIPVCEFQTLEKGNPFPTLDNGTTRRESHLMALGTDLDADAWEYKDVPGVRLGWPHMYDRPRSHHAVIAANESDFDDEKLHYYGGRSDFSLSSYIDDHINVMLGRWALWPVIGKLERHFNLIRDSAHLQRQSRKAAVKALEKYSDLYSSCVDIGAVAEELQRFTSDLRDFSHDVACFRPCRPEFYGDKDANLSTILCESLNRRTRILVDTSNSFQTLLTQQSTAVGTLENVRLQKSIKILTWLIALLTAIMAWGVLVQELDWRNTDREHPQSEVVPQSPSPP